MAPRSPRKCHGGPNWRAWGWSWVPDRRENGHESGRTGRSELSTISDRSTEYLREQFPEKRLILLWDGASYHRGVEMQEYLEAVNLKRSRDEWWVTCMLFAPNAPEQNPMEDVWLKAKQYVRKHWRECPTFQLVMHVFEEALNTLSFQFEKLRMYLPNLEII